MENIQDKSIFEFNFDEESKTNLSSIAQWANINAIVGFAAIGISIISFIVGFGKLSGPGSSAVAGTGILGLLIGLAISLALNITLINAATNMKKGIESADQGFFTTGLTKLAVYFKIVGILTIIVISIFALAMLVVMMVGATRGFQ